MKENPAAEGSTAHQVLVAIFFFLDFFEELFF